MLQCLRSYHAAAGPFLIIAPLSTIQHWQREVNDWTTLHGVVFHGNEAARAVLLDFEWSPSPRGAKAKGWGNGLAHPKFDVCITTYETYVQCVEHFKKVRARACLPRAPHTPRYHHPTAASPLPHSTCMRVTWQVVKWEYVVLDEAHRLKNKFGKAIAAVKALGKVPMLALSGTPLQNHVGELWSILNLLDETAFESSEAFLEAYGDMTSASQVGALTEKLRRYLLRRTKGDVDLGLAPMEETLISVEITNFQKQTYRALLEQNRTLLLRGATNVTGPSFNNLAMQLRHCCNHPFLIKGVIQSEGVHTADDDTYLDKLVASSGKLVLLDKLLPKLQVQGHRVLLFSQFTMLLDLLEDYIRLRAYTYERLDGNVRGEQRQQAIDRFCAKDSSTFLFLLGTRAGGVGINLVAADTVIIYDPDWNPQNDVQAQARCHRIGQTKTVSVYRLVTKATYEYGMYEKANQKLGLEQAVIGRTDYTARGGGEADGEEGDGGGGKESKAAKEAKASEIEGLLKHGAQHLFTDDHDAKIAAFSDESIDSILARSTTSTTYEGGADAAGKGAASSSFAHASFVAQDGTEASLDMEDPHFWSKVLGDDEAVGAAGHEDDGFGNEREYDDEGEVAQRRSRRSVGQPHRLAPSWGEEEEAAAASGDAKSRPAKGQWTRPQLNALYAGLFAFGHGRHALVHSSHTSLAFRTVEEVGHALEYTTALALRVAASEEMPPKPEDDPDDEDADADAASQEPALDAAKLGRVWHYLQAGGPPAADGSLLDPPARAQGVGLSAGTWYDQRVVAQGRKMAAQLIDLRRLRTAIGRCLVLEKPFVAPRLPAKYAKPALTVATTQVCDLDDDDDDAAGAGGAGGEGGAGAAAAAVWTIAEDSELLMAAYRHGHSNWAAALADPTLPRLHALSLSGDAGGTAVAAAAAAAAAAAGDDAPEAMDVEGGGAGSSGLVVEARALGRRLKTLLNYLPITSSSLSDGSAAIEGGAAAKSAEDAAETFVLGLYPTGYDRTKPPEPLQLDGGAIASASGGGGGGGEKADKPSRVMGDVEKTARREAKEFAKELAKEAKAQAKADKSERAIALKKQLLDAKERARVAAAEQREREKSEALASKAKARSTKERERALAHEAKAREKAARDDERTKSIVEKWLDEVVMKCAKQHVRDKEREERGKVEAEANALKEAAKAERNAERQRKEAEKEAELADRRAEREEERKKKDEERLYAERMRHMLKVRALDQQRVVYVALSTAPSTTGGEPAQVTVKFSMPANVTAVSRLADGITRLMDEYDWTNKQEAFKKGHRWMQLLDSVELGLQRNIGAKYAVRSSMGCGGWAKVPWLAVSDPSESTQHGLYLQYLFRADMSAVYLCLGQGTSLLKKAFGNSAAARHLSHVGEFVRGKVKELLGDAVHASGLDLDGGIALHSGSQGLGADYEKGCVVARMYPHGEPLEEGVLLAQLDEMIEIYEAILTDDKYALQIKAPMDKALADGGHLKKKGQRKSLLLLEGPKPAAPVVSAGQKRAAAREASSALAAGGGGDDDDDDEADAAGGDGGGGSSAGDGDTLWWLKADEGSGKDGRAKRARTDAGPSSGGSGGRGGRGGTRRSEGKAPAASPSAAPAASPVGSSPAASPAAAPRGRMSALEKAIRDFPVGMRVEVLQEDDGYAGAWFGGVVTGHASPDKVRVKYEELTEYDDETEETTKYENAEVVKRVRPEPPKAAASWRPGDGALQLFYIGGWWDVVLTARLEDGKLQVKAMQYDVTHTVSATDLRPAPGWVWNIRAKAWEAKGMAAAVAAAAAAATAGVEDDDEVLEADVDEVEVEPMLWGDDE